MANKNKFGPEFNEKFRNRSKLIREAKELLIQKEQAQAAFKFQEYLSLIARFHEVPIIDLQPHHFDPKKEAVEMLMITQVCWELIKIYERAPKLEVHYNHCIDIFVRFTLNQTYQQLNAEMLRRYLVRSNANNKDKIREAYATIQLKSRKCFVATYCFGENHLYTNNLRSWKQRQAKKRFFIEFIHQYYQYSPKLISFMDRSPVARRIILPLIRKTLIMFNFFIAKADR